MIKELKEPVEHKQTCEEANLLDLEEQISKLIDKLFEEEERTLQRSGQP